MQQGSGADAIASVAGGHVTSIHVVHAGSGYVAPTVTLSPPPADLRYETYWSNDGTSHAGSEPTSEIIVPVMRGLFSVMLGDTTLPNMQTLPSSVFRHPDAYLRVWFGNGAGSLVLLTNDLRLGSVGYAMMAAQVSTDGLAESLSQPPFANTFWRPGGNSGTRSGIDYLGTADSQPLVLAVNGAQAIRLEATIGTANIIGGSSANGVSPGVIGGVIGGGGDFDPGVFPVPHGNFITDNFGTVGGGKGNIAGDNSGNTRDAQFATASGGEDNLAKGGWSVVSGGGANLAAADHSTVGGGSDNRARGRYSTIGGGYANLTVGQDDTVAGGHGNVAGLQGGQEPFTTATVGGGADNTASGNFSTVVGGFGNQAEGDWATVLGGWRNRASGRASLAGGANATAQHDYSFVWAGGVGESGSPFSSTGPNQFCIGAPGGVRLHESTSLYCGTQSRQMINLWGETYAIGVQEGFNTLYFRSGRNPSGRFSWYLGGVHADRGSGLRGNEIMSLSNHGLTVNGCIEALSARDAKENIEPVDTLDILNKVLALPITKWSYKETDGVRHLGPMAQDFYAAFAVGNDDTHIATVDADGVALASIQALNKQLAALQAQIASRDVEIQDLGLQLKTTDARMTALENGIAKTPIAFVHQADETNILGNITYLSHPSTISHPEAILTVTPNWNPGGAAGIYDPHPISVQYTGTRWAILNQDLAPMPKNCAFNVLVTRP